MEDICFNYSSVLRYPDLRFESPDIFKYWELFTPGIKQVYIGKDDYGYFHINKREHEFLNRYAQQNELNLNELILYFRIGYLEGKTHFKERMDHELTVYQFDGIKNYLLNIIVGGNGGKFPSYVGSQNGIPSKIHPKRIQDIGFQNAIYHEAWLELIEKHRLFNDFFKEINIKEYKRNSNNPYSQMFPKRYFQDPNVPDSVQCASDLNRNCYTLIDVLKNKIIPFKDEEGKIQNLHFIIQPDNTSQFYDLCRDFLKEAANNHEKALVEINKEYYKSVIHRAEECIEILQDPMFRNCNMSSFDGFENTKRNWFITISDSLIGNVNSFKKKYDFLFNYESIESQTDSEVSMQKVETTNTTIENITQPKKEELSDKQNETTPLLLSDVFESASRYNHIMKILVEQKKCQPESHIWIGTEKGDYSYLAAILKYLHSQGYYKNKKLTNEQIKEICINTFKWEISINTIKKAKPENFDLKIITLASTLDL